MSEHPFLLSSMFWHPVVGMLKFCTILITSAMSSASFNLCLMASKLNIRRPVENEFFNFWDCLEGLLS